MKKLLTTLFAIATTVIAVADPITPSKALELSQRFMPQDQTQTLEMCAKRSGKFDDISYAKGNKPQTSSPYYIISRGAGNGFVIVSGDDCLPEIIGVVEHGDYDENDMPESFRDWLQYRADQVEYAQAKGINTPFQSTAFVAGRQDVGPLLETLWHQSSPYNDRCPRLTSNGNRAATGCVATAASQIAYYWRRDARTTTAFNTPTYTYGDAPVTSEYVIKRGTPLKWDLMQKKYGSEPAEYKDAVATLVAMMGMSCNLTYGASTGGQIADMVDVFKNQIGINGGVCVYKSYESGLVNGFTEAKWSELLYNQLIQKRPVLYCGYNSGSGGHAVVCDGYQASTGYFHINFGWGDNYNGFFSVEDGVKGWGFNESWTGCVYDIYANKPNVEVTMTIPERIFKGDEVKFGITMKNKSTLPFKGVYLFVQTSTTIPTKLTSAKAAYMEEIPVDGSAEFELKSLITGTTAYTVFLMDENLNTLHKATFKPEAVSPEISFSSIAMAASSDKETMGGEEYGIVYNTSATVTATVKNSSDKSYYGSLLLNVFNYNATSGEWKKVGTASGSAAHKPLMENTVTFSLTSTHGLRAGNYYYASLSDSISLSKDKIGGTDDSNNIVRFKVVAKDMAVVSFTNNVLKLKGHFDQTLFNSTSFAKKATYKTAVAYDLTDCQSVSCVSQEVNPNALYYVSDDSKAEGDNIIKGGHATRLVLTPGYDFVPKADFTTDATVVSNCVEKPGQWYMLTAPAALNVPVGMAAREITGHSTLSSGLSGKVDEVKTLEPGKTYLVMTSSADCTTLTGGSSAVVAAPVANKDVTVKGTYSNIATEAGGVTLAMGADGVQYLQPTAAGASVEALRGYMLDSKATVAMRTYKHITYDKYYLTLAADIVKAYQLSEKYADVVDQKAVSALIAEAKAAEEVFSYREADVDYNSVKAAYERLELICMNFMREMPSMVNLNNDCTSLIKNPSFELKSTTGWKVGSATYAKAVVGTGVNMQRGVGLDGDYLLQNLYAADSTSVSLSQTVLGLVPGTYRLTAKIGTGTGRKVTLFAGSDEAIVTAHPYGRLYLTDAVLDNIMVLADKDSETGSLTIGIKAGDWYKADDFRLTLVHTLNSGVKGDLNGDGKVTMQDVNIAINRAYPKEDLDAILDTYLGK